MRISKMHPIPFWTCILFIVHLLPTQELFAAELDHGTSVQRNQRDISGKFNPHAGEHQHNHKHDGGEHHPHEGEQHHHPVDEEHKHVEEAQAQNTIENYEEAPIGYEYVAAGDQGAIEAPDTKFDYDDKGTVAPVCGCVLKGQCGGIKEDQDTIDILRATPTTLVCGLKYQMCCKYDYYENGKPWPGVVDLYLDKAPCVAEEICKRPYGVQPTDVRDYGTIPHCPGFGSVRCLDSFVVKDNSPLVFPNEHPTPIHIDVPILPVFETNEISGGLFVEEPKEQTPLVPLLPISEPEIPKTSYGVPSIPYTYLPPTPPPIPEPTTETPTTPGYIYPEPPPTTPTPPPPTTPPPPPPTTPPTPPPPTTPPGYIYPTPVPTQPPIIYRPPSPVTPPPYLYAPPQPVTEEETSSVIAPPPPVIQPTPVYVPPPPVIPPTPVYVPPPPVTEEETSSVIAPPPPVIEPTPVYVPPPPVPPPTPVYSPPAQVYEPPSTYTAPLVDAGLIEDKPAVPVFSTSRYYTPTLGYYRPKYYKRPKIGYFGAPYFKNFYYNPYYGGYNGIYGSGGGFQKRISFSKQIGLGPGFQKQFSFSKQIGAGLYGR